MNALISWCNRIILWSFHILFFLVPLLFSPINYELFEYSKMMATYGLTIIITAAWAVKMVVSSKQQAAGSQNKTILPTANRQLPTAYLFIRTPFDIPIFLFLISQIISTIISMDQHVSIWGYYSRFNGGLLSTLSYILLYYALVHTVTKDQIPGLIKAIFASAMLVSFWGIAEHFGVDKNIWVQDVQNRVFSTLGQPNWLASYMAVLIPIALAYTREKKWTGSILAGLFFATLLFTKSRSGLLGLGIALGAYGLLLFFSTKKIQIRPIIPVTIIFVAIVFIFGTPFQNVNRFLLQGLLVRIPSTNSGQTKQTPPPPQNDILDVGISESGDIRKIVWSGAIDITRHYPLFGSGVETFAFSYYQFRPAAHNMTSEWDFLYNKAHNEFLNMAATTGFVGLGTYLLLIGWIIWWNIKRVWSIRYADCLPIALFSGWLSIHPTNFFGFSVVIIQIFFFLIPAMLVVLHATSDWGHPEPAGAGRRSEGSRRDSSAMSLRMTTESPLSLFKKAIIIAILLMSIYLLWNVITLWYADTVYKQGYNAGRAGELAQSYQALHDALVLNPREPNYYDELALTASQLAVGLAEKEQSTMAAQLTKEAITASDVALEISPNNVNFWKTRTRVLYEFSQLDPTYLQGTQMVIEKAKSLSPTDPKIRYNLALVYNALDKKDEAYRELEAAEKLKPNYKEPFFAMALFYERDKKIDKAKEQLQYILKRIDPNDQEVKKKLEELK